MPRVSGHGITAGMPRGFEATIYRRQPGVAGERTYPVAHFATFALPASMADFGTGAVELMGAGDIFVTLHEYGPESLGTALFARSGMPRELQPTDFRPYLLRKGIGGQAGSQWFFTEAARPFSLYVVLGSFADRTRSVPLVNALLASIQIAPPTASALGDTPSEGEPATVR
jgi:hypothetical protein